MPLAGLTVKDLAGLSAQRWEYEMPNWWLINGTKKWVSFGTAMTIAKGEAKRSGERSSVKLMNRIHGRHRAPGAAR